MGWPCGAIQPSPGAGSPRIIPVLRLPAGNSPRVIYTRKYNQVSQYEPAQDHPRTGRSPAMTLLNFISLALNNIGQKWTMPIRGIGRRSLALYLSSSEDRMTQPYQFQLVTKFRTPSLARRSVSKSDWR